MHKSTHKSLISFCILISIQSSPPALQLECICIRWCQFLIIILQIMQIFVLINGRANGREKVSVDMGIPKHKRHVNRAAHRWHLQDSRQDRSFVVSSCQRPADCLKKTLPGVWNGPSVFSLRGSITDLPEFLYPSRETPESWPMPMRAKPCGEHSDGFFFS